MSLLDLVPGFSLVKLAIIGGAIAGAVGLYAWRVHVERDTGRAEVQQKWDANVSNQRAAAVVEAEINAKETLRRLQRQKDAQDEFDKIAAQSATDRARADAAGVSLRNAATRYAAAACPTPSAPAPVGISAPAATAPMVLAELLSGVDQAAGELATAFDAARNAGLQCEAEHVTAPP